MIEGSELEIPEKPKRRKLTKAEKRARRERRAASPKLTKLEKRAKRIARFLVRIDPTIAADVKADMSNEAVASILEPFFDEKYLSLVHKDYKQVCKEIIATKDSYLKSIRTYRGNFAPMLMERLEIEDTREQARMRRKIRRERQREHSHLVSWTVHLTADVQGLFDDLQEVTSAPEMARRVDTHSFKEDINYIDLNRGQRRPSDLLYAIAALPGEEFQAFRKSLLKRLETEIRTAEEEQTLLEKIAPQLKILEAQNAVMIDIVELVFFGYNTWGMKIYVGTHPEKMQGYLFDFEAKSVKEILEVIQEVIDDYRTQRSELPANSGSQSGEE
jgi:hypothetical protein